MASEVELALPDVAATARLGHLLGEHLRPGHTVGLCGEMGTGKTMLVRELATRLGLDDADAVVSPTYLLVLEHPGARPLLHADAYLPQKLAGFLGEGGLDYLLDRRAVVAVEWADRVRDMMPQDTLWIELAVAGPGRTARLHSTSPEHRAWLPALAREFALG